MHHLDAVGAKALYKQLETLKSLRGDRFTPDPGWEALTHSLGAETT
jgi:hypothetical protein